MRRIPLVVCLALPVLVAIALYHVFAPHLAWWKPIHVGVSALVAVVALATAIAALAGAARVHVALAITLALPQLAVIAARLGGFKLMDHELYPSRRLAVVVAATLVLAIYGLMRGRLWARWLTLALGVVGMMSGALNAWNYWHVTDYVDTADVAWSVSSVESLWVLLVMALGGAIVVVNMLMPAVRDMFAARAHGTTWVSNDRVIGAVRLAIVGAFVAVPMLLVYAWLQPIVAATRPTALALAAALTIASVFAVRGKLIGALLLVACGLALVAQTAATFAGAADSNARFIACYYAVFWLPAAIAAMYCGARLARPAIRLLRG
jgi:hypothetical protein